MNENIINLLKKYSDDINDAMVGYDVNLNKIAILLNGTSIVSHDTYSFTRE